MSESTSTHPAAPDPRLRGRTYAISFDRVWNVALRLAGGGLSRWQVVHADDEEGFIQAETVSLLLRRRANIRIQVTLDENAQTRVDLASSTDGKGDWGRSARRIHRFLRTLDGKLAATPAQILDATHRPQFTD